MSQVDEQTSGAAARAKRKVTIEIDGEGVTAPEHRQTARQLLALVGKSADEWYLVHVKGKRERESYKDRPDEEIALRQEMKFITVRCGPTPVS